MFKWGQWIHVRDNLRHPFAGYDGQVIDQCEDVVRLEIYDLILGSEPTLIPNVYEFQADELCLVRPGRVTSYEVLQTALRKIKFLAPRKSVWA